MWYNEHTVHIKAKHHQEQHMVIKMWHLDVDIHLFTKKKQKSLAESTVCALVVVLLQVILAPTA